MTDTQDLIARLRKDDLFWEAPITCRSEAADALEAAQAEIEAQQHRIQSLWMERDVVRVERDKALARLAEIERQEPVMVYDGRCIWDCGDGGHQDVTMLKMIAKGTKLYAAAGASPVQPVQGLQSVADALTIEQLNDKVDRLMAVQPSQAQAALDAILWYYENCTGSEPSISAFQQMVDRVVKMRPNFCESCAMGLSTCDCVTPRPVFVNQLPSAQPSQAQPSSKEVSMVKLPQPHGAAVHKGEVLEYTEAQLKQAVRDVLSLAADTCESTLYVEGDGTVSVFGPKTGANVEIRKCRDAIHAIIAAINAKESGK